jgi:hypothetical protein
MPCATSHGGLTPGELSLEISRAERGWGTEAPGGAIRSRTSTARRPSTCSIPSIIIANSARCVSLAEQGLSGNIIATLRFPFVDQGSRTAVVEALANAARRFLPGQYVTMQFVIGVSIPASAVGRMGG